MPTEPDIKRAVSFIDGQNLFRHAKDAFGRYHPNYDPRKLSNAVCEVHGWNNQGVRFYTGIPSAERDAMWHGYWTRRLTTMRRAGIVVTSRHLRYRTERILLEDGSSHEIPVQREKGIDLRLGLDVVRMARHGELDVAVIFSQDQDLAESSPRSLRYRPFGGQVAEDGFGFSAWSECNVETRNRRNRLVSHGSGLLRCVPRSEGLSPGYPGAMTRQWPRTWNARSETARETIWRTA